MNKANGIKLILICAVQLSIGLLLLLGVRLAIAAENVATVLLVKGPVTAQQPGETGRTLLNGDDIMQGDVINTDASSYVVVGFIDGAKITIRPDTTFTIDAYAASSTAFDMAKGGLRALTGKFSKDMPEGFRLQTPIATLGVRGTHFDARICERADRGAVGCEYEEREIHKDKLASEEGCEFDKIPEGLYMTVYIGIVAVIQGNNERLVTPGEALFVDLNGNMKTLPCVPLFFYQDFIPSPINYNKIQSLPSAGGGVAASPGGGASNDAEPPPPPPPPPEPITEPATPDLKEEPLPQASPN